MDWAELERMTRDNLLLMRELERKMAERGIPVPPKRMLIALAEQALISNVQIINNGRGK